jgi:cell division protein YceG involved in septum cleavage
MDPEQRIQLQKLVEANGTEDHTEVIRRVKHSSQIYQDVMTMIKLKHDYGRLAKSNPTQFDAICVSRCAFLFTYYTDLYNKLKTGEIDLNLLLKMIQILRKIEDGKLDQHEGSFEVGKILKSIYVDSALKRAENLDAEKATKEKRTSTKAAKSSRPAIPEKKMSWADFKALQCVTVASATTDNASTPTPTPSAKDS